MVDVNGYKSIIFKGWLSLDVNPSKEVLQKLANAAPNAHVYTFDQQSSLGVKSSLNSSHIFFFAYDVVIMMLNTSNVLT